MRAIALPADAGAAAFRDAARAALAAGLAPGELVFGAESALFGAPPPAPADFRLTAPRGFVELMDSAAMHRAPDRFALLYQVLWRLKHGEPDLLSRASDPAVAALLRYAKNVGRDIHKTHAFVRFREAASDDGRGPIYMAWFEPLHYTLRAAAPFFADRFAQMRWVIMTPQGVAQHLDGRLTFGPAAPKPDLPGDAALDELWNIYFRTIFNPARVMQNAMLREMPKQYWKNMPETALIPGMVRGARGRVQTMAGAPDIAPRFAAKVAEQRAMRAGAAAPVLPLEKLRAEAGTCQRCPLHACATRTVFGEGPADARIMLVGEQPGDKEDLAGRAFIGPAGQMLDRALAEAGIARGDLYVTNAVKHFKHELRGKRRLHKTPERPEIEACRFWLEWEVAAVKPALVVALGATAAHALTGRKAAVQKERGRPVELMGRPGLITVHPSFLLRLPDAAAQRAEYARFVDDLRQARDIADGRAAAA